MECKGETCNGTGFFMEGEHIYACLECKLFDNDIHARQFVAKLATAVVEHRFEEDGIHLVMEIYG